MKGAISYSLFGYDRNRYENCFDHLSYLRSMHICIRLNRILYPEWNIVLNIDEASYNSPYKKIYDWHRDKGFIKIKLFENGLPLCKAMLRRLHTVFSYVHPEWEYTHVICRDLDSIPTFREAQMVKQWVDEDKALHCITDSVSHTIPILGGMIGMRPGYVNDLMKISNQGFENIWDDLMKLGEGIDFSRKGTDQDFMNRYMYPKLCVNATEHFIKGKPHDLIEGNGRHYSIDETIDIGVDPKFKETNLLAGHVGAAGFYEAPTMKFLFYEDPYREEYLPLEKLKQFDKIFYWQTREDLR